MRLNTPRAAHEREGHERLTLARILAEQAAVLDLVDAQDPRTMLWANDEDTAGLSPDQESAVENIGALPWLVQPLSAPGARQCGTLPVSRHRYGVSAGGPGS